MPRNLVICSDDTGVRTEPDHPMPLRSTLPQPPRDTGRILDRTRWQLMRGVQKRLERMRISWVGAVAAIVSAAPPRVDVSAAQTFRQPGKLPEAIQQPREIEPLRGPGGWLGVTLRNLTPAEADQWLLDAGGAVIEVITEGGPAWRVGL